MVLTMTFPPGIAVFPLSPPANVTRGTPALTPNANNQVTVDTNQVPLQILLDAGFTYAPTVCTTAGRSVTPCPGQPIFDSTLGKPVWRNAANTNWVDATGATV